MLTSANRDSDSPLDGLATGARPALPADHRIGQAVLQTDATDDSSQSASQPLRLSIQRLSEAGLLVALPLGDAVETVFVRRGEDVVFRVIIGGARGLNPVAATVAILKADGDSPEVWLRAVCRCQVRLIRQGAGEKTALRFAS
ncbi:hypothetical protein AB0D47_40010 [Streptomyces sp. NPDC048376]|jgi:hypothetical protein|uniref:hypothetical protein n=1 Tax=unclassified Streptomyces TaxID=2593676 RepID=UPI0006995354